MARPLGRCPKCSELNPYKVLACQTCGARLPWADAVAASQQHEPSALQPHGTTSHPQVIVSTAPLAMAPWLPSSSYPVIGAVVAVVIFAGSVWMLRSSEGQQSATIHSRPRAGQTLVSRPRAGQPSSAKPPMPHQPASHQPAKPEQVTSYQVNKPRVQDRTTILPLPQTKKSETAAQPQGQPARPPATVQRAEEHQAQAQQPQPQPPQQQVSEQPSPLTTRQAELAELERRRQELESQGETNTSLEEMLREIDRLDSAIAEKKREIAVLQSQPVKPAAP